MRVLLDEHLPVDLALELAGHDVDTVVGRGWAGIKNGDLLRRMSSDYDVLITMDRGIEFQQPIAGFPFGVVIAHAASAMAARVPADLLDGDRRLAQYARAIEALQRG